MRRPSHPEDDDVPLAIAANTHAQRCTGNRCALTNQEVTMFARVSSYEIPPERAGDATHTFQQAIGQIRAMNGLAAAYLLVNAETGRVLTMTLWDTAAAMEASRVAASRLRTEAVRTVDGNIVNIEEYEVAARELGDVA